MPAVSSVPVTHRRIPEPVIDFPPPRLLQQVEPEPDYDVDDIGRDDEDLPPPPPPVDYLQYTVVNDGRPSNTGGPPALPSLAEAVAAAANAGTLRHYSPPPKQVCYCRFNCERCLKEGKWANYGHQECSSRIIH